MITKGKIIEVFNKYAVGGCNAEITEDDLELFALEIEALNQEQLNIPHVVESWICPMDNEPPLNTEVLAKDPNGNVHLTTWRGNYNIFSCQGKSEGVYDWVWKNI